MRGFAVKKLLTPILTIMILFTMSMSGTAALATKLPEAPTAGAVSKAAVEAFAARAEGATTESVAIYGSDTCGKFINWCFNAVPELVAARGGQESGSACISLVQALLWKKLGNFFWTCNGTITGPNDSSLWNRWVGELGPASQFQRVSSFTPKRGDIVVFSSGYSATVLSHAGIMTSETKWKHSSGGTVYPNPKSPWEGFNVEASYNNSKYNWSEYIVGFFRFNTELPDTVKPTVNSVSISGKDLHGFSLLADVSDDRSLASVMVGIWTDAVGIDNAVWESVEVSGSSDTADIYFDTEGLGRAVNTKYHANVYAVDTAGNISSAYRSPDVFIEDIPPVLKRLNILNVSSTGFDVNIQAQDNDGIKFIYWYAWNDEIGIGNSVDHYERFSGTSFVDWTYHVNYADLGGASNTNYYVNAVVYDLCENSCEEVRTSVFIPKTVPLEQLIPPSSPMNVLVGSSEDLYAEFVPGDVFPLPVIVWTSDDESTVAVQRGVLTGLKPGVAWVTCAADGNEAVNASTLVVVHAAQRLMIPDGTRVIQADAFRGSTALQEVVLPAGIQKIESGAFADCPNLRLILAPSATIMVESGAFSGCQDLTVLTYPNSTFMDYMFQTLEITKCAEYGDW